MRGKNDGVTPLHVQHAPQPVIPAEAGIHTSGDVGTRSRNSRNGRKSEKSPVGTHEPGWLKHLRDQSWERFESGSWEDIDIESWRYVKPQAFLDKMSINKEAPAEDTGQQPAIHSAPSIYVKSFSELDPTDANHVTRLLERARSYMPYDRFRCLHESLFDSSLFMDVPANTSEDQPVLIDHTIRQDARFPFLIIRVGAGARVKIVDQLLGGSCADGERGSCADGDQSLGYSRILCWLEEGAHVEFVSIQNLQEDVSSLHQHEFFLDAHATLEATYLPLGSGLSRTVQEVRFIGQGSSAKTNGLTFGHRRQTFDFHSYQHHVGEHTQSELFFRNVVTDHAKATFIGNVYIDKSARHTRAHQTNKNLLLSPTAEAITVPKLEIDTEEVVCGHGATVSSIDENEIFYLQSRGLSRASAQKMIIQGFYEDVIARIPSTDLQDKVRSVLDQRLAEVSI